MAFDSFIKFIAAAGGTSESFKGESLDSEFSGTEGWFSIKEFSFGIENTLNISTASGGAGAGKADFKEFTVKKQTDRASPYLAMTCGKGGHYAEVDLQLRKSGSAKVQGKAGQTYLSYKFKLVAVKSIEWSGSSGDDVPEETVVFEYGAMQMTYYPQLADGTMGNMVQRTWNKLSNSTSFTVPGL